LAGIKDLAVAIGIGTTRKVPLVVPVKRDGMIEVIGFGADSLLRYQHGVLS
jgi:hypothetical protein